MWNIELVKVGWIKNSTMIIVDIMRPGMSTLLEPPTSLYSWSIEDSSLNLRVENYFRKLRTCFNPFIIYQVALESNTIKIGRTANITTFVYIMRLSLSVKLNLWSSKQSMERN